MVGEGSNLFADHTGVPVVWYDCAYGYRLSKHPHNIQGDEFVSALLFGVTP
jgi:hypothetical protein